MNYFPLFPFLILVYFQPTPSGLVWVSLTQDSIPQSISCWGWEVVAPVPLEGDAADCAVSFISSSVWVTPEPGEDPSYSGTVLCGLPELTAAGEVGGAFTTEENGVAPGSWRRSSEPRKAWFPSDPNSATRWGSKKKKKNASEVNVDQISQLICSPQRGLQKQAKCCLRFCLHLQDSRRSTVFFLSFLKKSFPKEIRHSQDIFVIDSPPNISLCARRSRAHFPGLLESSLKSQSIVP